MTLIWSSDSESELSFVRSIIGTGAMLEAMVVVLEAIGWVMVPNPLGSRLGWILAVTFYKQVLKIGQSPIFNHLINY